MPSYGFDASGFTPKTLDVIKTETESAIRLPISDKLDLGTSSPLGQFVGVTASQLAQLWEAIQVAYAQRDPNQATGEGLRVVASYAGVKPREAEPSRAGITCDLAAGTYAAGVLRLNKIGNAAVTFVNEEEITTAGGTGLGPFTFACTVDGPTVAMAGELEVIASPVTGFANPTNPENADVGHYADTDVELRQAREDGLARKGSTSTDAIRADLLNEDNVPGVDYASVLGNDGDTVDVNGLPGHSIEAIVLGGDPADIAQTIYASKAAGIETYGTETVVVYSSSGQPFSVHFSRPTDVLCTFYAVVSYLKGSYPSSSAAEAAVKTAVLNQMARQGVGNDVALGVYYREIFKLPGIVGGTLTMARSPNPSAAADVPMGVRELAFTDNAAITVLATAVPGIP